MSVPPPWLVGFWSRPTLAKQAKTGYLFCGVMVGPRQVLTVKHALSPGRAVYARRMAASTDAFKVIDVVSHDHFDAAILTLSMAQQAPVLPWATEEVPAEPLRLMGVFEGSPYDAEATLGRPDPTHSHHTFTPEQPQGVSGGALVFDGRLWGMAVRRYGREGIGCAIPFYLLRDWLAKELRAAGLDVSSLPPPAHSAEVPWRVRSITKWLDLPDIAPLSTELIVSAKDAHSSAPGAEVPPADAIASLMLLSRYRTPNDPIAGIHLVGRALNRSRAAMGEDGHARLVAPRVPDLLACILGLAFDCDCTAIDEASDVDTSRLKRTPFADITATAMLAAQLFQGQLRFVPAEGGGLRPQWVFELNSPANGERPRDALYREAHRRMVGVDSLADVQAQRESKPLTEAELKALRRRIRERLIEDECLVAFVEGSPQLALSPTRIARGALLAEDLDVNVLLMAEDPAGRSTLRMDLADFEDAVHSALERHATPQPRA